MDKEDKKSDFKMFNKDGKCFITDGKGKYQKTYEVIRKFNNKHTFEELLAQVIRSHS